MKIYKDKDYITPRERVHIFKREACPFELPHMHEFMEIVYIYSGEAKHMIGDMVYDVSEGDLLFIDVGQVHSICDNDCKSTIVNIILKPDFISNELINSLNIFEVFALSAYDDYEGEVENSVRVVHFDSVSRIDVKHLIDCMLDEFENKKVGYRSAIAGYMNVLFSYTLRSIQRSQKGDGMGNIDTLASEVLTYIEKNISEKVTLDELAAKCFYTPSYFCRVFKQNYGMTFKSYIKKKRIEMAMKYLTESNLSIEKICEMVGYTQRSLFFKHFREECSLTPSEYRKTFK